MPPTSRRHRVTARAHRRLFERGVTPPWVLSAAGCDDLWSTRTNDDANNGPARYANKSLDIVQFLNDFWTPDVDTGQSVLEIGCNSGPNLEGLRRLGFQKLSGIDINLLAIMESHAAFPELAEIADLRAGDSYALLSAMPSASVDVALSLATLVCTPPAANRVMTEMVRVARRFVCVIEAEWLVLPHLFARDYRRMFERLGAREVRSHTISPRSLPDSPLTDYVGYTARLFRLS